MIKFMKKTIASLLALSMIFTLGACTQANTSENQDEEASTVSAEITINDAAGRSVTLESDVETIVSTYYISTYAMIALGVEDRIIGLESKADTREIYNLAAPELTTLPQVGSMKQFNVEAVAELEPELVILPIMLMEHVETLEQLGLSVLVVNPETEEGLNQMLTLIALVTGEFESDLMLKKFYDEKYTSLESALENVEKPTVYMASNSSFLQAATTLMYQNDVINKAGGTNAVTDDENTYWVEVSYEALLEINPDYIIIPPMATYTAEDIYNDATIKDLKAVQNKTIYQMPKGLEEWDSPIPSSVLGVLWLASKLHPEHYTYEQFESSAIEFYSEFYDLEIDTTLLK